MKVRGGDIEGPAAPFLLENINAPNDYDINTSETIKKFLTLKVKTSRESALAKRFKVKYF